MASASLPLPKFTFLPPETTPKLRLSLSRFSLSRFSLSRRITTGASLRGRVRAVQGDGVVVEDRESELLSGGNGAANLNGNGGYGYNGSVEGYTNGASNGILPKYVNGNGAAAVTVVEEVYEVKTEVDGVEKKTIEEIGQEEAWFKRSGQGQIEV